MRRKSRRWRLSGPACARAPAAGVQPGPAEHPLPGARDVQYNCRLSSESVYVRDAQQCAPRRVYHQDPAPLRGARYVDYDYSTSFLLRWHLSGLELLVCVVSYVALQLQYSLTLKVLQWMMYIDVIVSTRPSTDAIRARVDDRCRRCTLWKP